MKILTEWILRTLVLLIITYFVPGFKIDSYLTAFTVALVLGVLNMLLKPILVFFTLPLNILTLGLFTFIINAVLLMVASTLVKGFRIDSFGTAVIAAVVISLISSVLGMAFK